MEDVANKITSMTVLLVKNIQKIVRKLTKTKIVFYVITILLQKMKSVVEKMSFILPKSIHAEMYYFTVVV